MDQILPRYAAPVYPVRDTRPDPHSRRNGRGGYPTGGVPQPVVLDEVRGQVLIPADADAPAEGPGLFAPDVLTLGMLGGGSPYIPDVADYVPPADASDWMSDSGLNEMDGVRSLARRMQRECPGINVRISAAFSVSLLTDGTEHTDRRVGWEVTAWRGTQTYNGSSHNLEDLAAKCCARFLGLSGVPAAAGREGR